MEGYVNAKKNVMKNQTAEDFVVLNYDDPLTRAIGESAAPQVIYFSSTQVLENGYYLSLIHIWMTAEEFVLLPSIHWKTGL